MNKQSILRKYFLSSYAQLQFPWCWTLILQVIVLFSILFFGGSTMPLMKLLQNIDSDERYPTKHKKLPQSDDDSDQDIVSFQLRFLAEDLLDQSMFYMMKFQSMIPDMNSNNSNKTSLNIVNKVNGRKNWQCVTQTVEKRRKARFPSFSTHVSSAALVNRVL